MRVKKYILGLFDVAAAIKKKREEKEAWDREWKEKQRAYAEQQRLLKLESQRIEVLQKQLSAWKEAAEIRTFIHEIKEQAAGDKENKQNFDAWCQWAERYLASIAPTLESFPDFEEPVKSEIYWKY